MLRGGGGGGNDSSGDGGKYGDNKRNGDARRGLWRW